MKKIILSFGSILFAGALLAGATGAFFADHNTSTGNTFATGVIDLKVDNESYVTSNSGALVASPSTSWNLSTLAGHLFFNFLDLKPGDVGEDTISLHVNNNNAWACMNIAVTATPENGQNDPEAAVDGTLGVNDGELQNNLYFAFWADDGDNVYESGEQVFKQGLVKDIFTGQNWPLADATHNIWGGTGPIQGDTVKYIGKAWCFGAMAQTPKTQDNKGKLSNSTNGPLVRGTGFTCSGADVGNIVQSDGIKADVSFSVAQARSNGSYLCIPGDPIPPPTSTSTLYSDNFNSSCQKGRDFGDSNSSHWDWHGHPKGGDDNDGHGKFADLDGGDSDHTDSISTKNINTQGYHNITLKYDRKTDDTGGPVNTQTLTVAFSVNGGTSWTTLETVTGETPWATKTFSLSPSADNKPNVKVRFTLVGTNSTNHAYIDNITVTGVSP